MAALAVNEPPLALAALRPPLHVDVLARLANLVASDERDAALRVFLGEVVGVPVGALQHPTIAVRTLALYGDASFAWLINVVKSLAEAIPNAEVTALPGQTHSPSPEMLAPELIRFFLR